VESFDNVSGELTRIVTGYRRLRRAGKRHRWTRSLGM